MEEETLFRSTLSEKETLITGRLLIPRKVCVALKAVEPTACETTSKLDGGGGAGGGGEGDVDLEQRTKKISKTAVSTLKARDAVTHVRSFLIVIH